MKQGIYQIEENIEIAKNTWKMRLLGDTSACTAPGQFVNLKLSGFFLRRPISVCDYDQNSITIIYKVVGDGTKAMTTMARIRHQESRLYTGSHRRRRRRSSHVRTSKSVAVQ